ncbi:putative vacuolar protein sorting-associated protein 24 homolog 2 [Impatiens glandulifera]|uniref:putative vacuolar protein sorting-associated protein 24 homolog 2 n=1 Tax=Impatiens glandulifera TaxID=253017 RepID=UPI001FB068C8|nr:putative vacuolar protein sorting-associated protein 24 homolog 2 [Impatiens glandulifera]
MHLGESIAIAMTVGHLAKIAKVMKLVNNLMKAPEIAITIQEFSQEMMKTGVIEKPVSDAIDSTMGLGVKKDRIEEEFENVLIPLAGETAAQLP